MSNLYLTIIDSPLNIILFILIYIIILASTCAIITGGIITILEKYLNIKDQINNKK